jgi:hypothetical protein
MSGDQSMTWFKVNPTLFLELTKRQFIQTREATSDTRALHFDAKTFDHYLWVGEHKSSGVELKAGRVVLIEGQHEHFLGVITYEEAWSEHGEETLKEWEAAYREKYGDYEESPYAHLRHPATFEVKAWIPERTFEALLTADLEHTTIRLFFTINPKEEGTIETQSGLWPRGCYALLT